MASCIRCHRSVDYDPYTDCPICQQDYFADVQAKHYPPGIRQEARESFSMRHWMKLQMIDRALRDGSIDKDEASIQLKKVVSEVNAAYDWEHRDKSTESRFILY